MINLGTFFRLHFDSDRISDDNIKKFAQDHIQRLIANNDANQYDQMIADTVSAYDAYFGAITDEDTAQALQESRSITVDNLFEQFQATASQKEGIIKGTWGKGSPEYEEFFPHGLTEYANATKANVETLMDRMVDAATAHAADLGQPFVDLFEQLLQDYTTARNTQLNQLGIVASDKSETAEKRDVVEIQLGKNVLILALEFIGKPAKAKVFFDESIIPKHASGGGEGGDEESTDIITAVTDQSIPGQINIDLSGTGGEEVTIDWGDTNTTPVTLQGSPASFAHTYTASGIYDIKITGSVEAIEVIRLSDTKLTAISFPDTMNPNSIEISDNQIPTLLIPNTFTNLLFLFASNNDLGLQSVNDLLVIIDSFGTSNGQIFLNGGTNAAPTGAGLTAKTNLENRGWTVNTN